MGIGVAEKQFTVAFQDASDEVLEIIEDEVVTLHNKMIDAGQAVWLTGLFKNSFSPIQKLSSTHWRIENDTDYASVLFRGRRMVNGRWYGSEKWAGGIDPMIAFMENEVIRKTNAIRR